MAASRPVLAAPSARPRYRPGPPADGHPPEALVGPGAAGGLASGAGGPGGCGSGGPPRRRRSSTLGAGHGLRRGGYWFGSLTSRFVRYALDDRARLAIIPAQDLLECVERGIDMFDCVMPTRNARHGRLFTTNGEINIKSAKYKNNFNSPDEECRTYTSENFSLAYIRHLFIAKEILGVQLATIHNLGFYLDLTKKIRASINDGTFREFKKSFLEKYLK